MEHKRKRFTKRKTKAGVLGANEIPFLLKQKLSQVSNATYGQEYYNSNIVDNILSHLPIQGVNEAITEHIIKNPVPTIYGLKNDAQIKEYPHKFIKILLGNFLAFRKKRIAPSYDNYILSRIPKYEIQSILTTNKFFIIDVDFLIKKFNLTGTNLTTRTTYSVTYRHKNKQRLEDNRSRSKKYKSYSAYISKKFTYFISDHLLPSYEAYLAIKDMIRIIINYLRPLHGRQRYRRTIQFQPQYYTDINIPANAIDIDGRERPFHEVWHYTKLGYLKYQHILYDYELTKQQLPWDTLPTLRTNIGPFDVILYYIYELNKQLEFLSIYRISINRALLDAINKDLSLIAHKMIELYELYEPGIQLQYTFDDINRQRFKIEIPPLTSHQSARLASNSIRPNSTRRRAKSI